MKPPTLITSEWALPLRKQNSGRAKTIDWLISLTNASVMLLYLLRERDLCTEDGRVRDFVLRLVGVLERAGLF